jgi:RNA polymerase sigma-70 factor, ECF subfamily
VSKPDEDIQLELIEAMGKVANHRDKQAFGLLFVYYASRLFYFALKCTGDRQTARDVAQETLAMIWQKAHLYNQDRGALTTWVYTIARNVCYDLGRQKSRRPQLVSSQDVYEDYFEYQHDMEQDDHQDLNIDKAILLRLVHQLPKEQCDVIELVYLHDMSQQRAAEHLQVPLGTVKSRIRLALNKLKEFTSKEMKDYE